MRSKDDKKGDTGDCVEFGVGGWVTGLKDNHQGDEGDEGVVLGNNGANGGGDEGVVCGKKGANGRSMSSSCNGHGRGLEMGDTVSSVTTLSITGLRGVNSVVEA